MNGNLNNVTHVSTYADAKIVQQTAHKNTLPANGQITHDWNMKRRLSSCDYEKLNQAANASFLRQKAQNVSNKSIQRYMKNFQMLQDKGAATQQSRETSPYQDTLQSQKRKNQERFDQSPQPNYPNFEPKKQASEAANVLSKPKIGDIGWGVKQLQAPKGHYSNYSNMMQENTGKNHVAYCNHLDNQKFTKMTGNFGANDDRKLEINGEIFNLMNASAQRISIKSLDMQRQSLERRGISKSPRAMPGPMVNPKDYNK